MGVSANFGRSEWGLPIFKGSESFTLIGWWEWFWDFLSEIRVKWMASIM